MALAVIPVLVQSGEHAAMVFHYHRAAELLWQQYQLNNIHPTTA